MKRAYLGLHNKRVVEKRNRLYGSCSYVMLHLCESSTVSYGTEAVATACYTLNRSLVHTLHGKTYYELLKGKKPNLQYFRVFGSLCYPTNDYDDVGKLKAKADIGIFVGYAPTKKAYRIYNKRTRKIQETVHVAFDELTEGLTSVQTSSGLAPQQMTSVPNSTELELTALQSGRSRSALVKDPEPPSVPPTKKQVDDLFQWFDDDEAVPIPLVVPTTPVNVPAAPAPEIANGSPSTTVISEGGPAVTENLLPHQIPLPDTSDSDVETLFDHVDSNVFFEPIMLLKPIQKHLTPTLSTSMLLPTTNYLMCKNGLKHIRLKTLLGIKTDPSLPGNSSKLTQCGASSMNS
ncbi:retrovirus-related pol polyprotein from transposon TNT 1-94 [Tanacetum coccineum]